MPVVFYSLPFIILILSTPYILVFIFIHSILLSLLSQAKTLPHTFAILIASLPTPQQILTTASHFKCPETCSLMAYGTITGHDY